MQPCAILANSNFGKLTVRALMFQPAMRVHDACENIGFMKGGEFFKLRLTGR